MADLLLIEDDTTVARLIARTLESASEQHRVARVSSSRAGFDHLARHHVDVVLLDYHLPDASGLEVLQKLRRQGIALPVIVITGGASEENAVEAMKLGVSDYILKHGRFLDNVPVVVREALGRGAIARCREPSAASPTITNVASRRLCDDIRQAYRDLGIVGESDALQDALILAERAATSSVPVLLEGETGTGKEVFARAIHARSARASGPFLAVNCGAVGDGVFGSELFGHVRGAFTGADRERIGLFEAASNGTLFLDELGETSPAIQVGLLRALQEGVVRPVGANRDRRATPRIITASNSLLEDAVAEGRFRADLLFRLCGFTIRLPPLRERPSDVPLLVEHFLARPRDASMAHAVARGVEFQPGSLIALEEYPWPGNVRELQNEVERLILCADAGQEIEPAMLSPRMRSDQAVEVAAPQLKDIVRAVETAAIRDRLRRHGYSRSATAASLGMTREGLWQKIRALGMQISGQAGREPKTHERTNVAVAAPPRRSSRIR